MAGIFMSVEVNHLYFNRDNFHWLKAKDASEMTPDERAELKKKEIEEEFNR